MGKRTAITGEVKVRIISNALSLEAFTVAQMRRATGLNPRSIQTVLQRLKRQGFLVSEPVEEAPPGSRRPPHLYRLTPDADKRLELARQVEAFYTPPPKLAPPEPTSRHYTAALRIIEQLEREQVAKVETAATVEKLRRHLELTASEEGLGVRRDAESEILAAHLALLRARLAMSQGHWAEAERNLKEATATFSSHSLDDLLARTKNLQADLRIRRTLTEPTNLTPMGILTHLLTEAPEIRLSLTTVRDLLQLHRHRYGQMYAGIQDETSFLPAEQKRPDQATDTLYTTRSEQIWRIALGELQKQVTRVTFETWVKDIRVLSYEEGEFTMGVHSAFAKYWLENQLLSLMKRTLSRIVGRSVDVSFVVWSPVEETADPSPPWTRTARRDAPHETLSRHYTFDQFVVGPANQLAYAASRAVADNPATVYNPLVIYGGVGLGKTHLLYAIGNHSYRQGLKVRYVSSENFTIDLINAIRTQTIAKFRERYRLLDMLLIDDIQFIAGKESTQEEFFHTFNALHASGRQVVIASDRAPKAILSLEDRLQSRLRSGLIADIQPPHLETRIAILRFKAKSKPVPVPDDVLHLIAHKVQSNVRELEGALNRVVAHAVLMQIPLTLDIARVALEDYNLHRGDFTHEHVIEAVAQFYGLESSDITGQSRNQLEAALERWPSPAAAHLALGLLHQLQGRTEEARQAYQRCLAEGTDESVLEQARVGLSQIT